MSHIHQDPLYKPIHDILENIQKVHKTGDSDKLVKVTQTALKNLSSTIKKINKNQQFQSLTPKEKLTKALDLILAKCPKTEKKELKIEFKYELEKLQWQEAFKVIKEKRPHLYLEELVALPEFRKLTRKDQQEFIRSYPTEDQQQLLDRERLYRGVSPKEISTVLPAEEIPYELEKLQWQKAKQTIDKKKEGLSLEELVALPEFSKLTRKDQQEFIRSYPTEDQAVLIVKERLARGVPLEEVMESDEWQAQPQEQQDLIQEQHLYHNLMQRSQPHATLSIETKTAEALKEIENQTLNNLEKSAWNMMSQPKRCDWLLSTDHTSKLRWIDSYMMSTPTVIKQLFQGFTQQEKFEILNTPDSAGRTPLWHVYAQLTDCTTIKNHQSKRYPSEFNAVHIDTIRDNIQALLKGLSTEQCRTLLNYRQPKAKLSIIDLLKQQLNRLEEHQTQEKCSLRIVRAIASFTNLLIFLRQAINGETKSPPSNAL